MMRLGFPRWIAAAVLLLAAPGCGAAERQGDWGLLLHSEDPVVYRGVVDFDSAGMGAGGMLYPGGAGVGGLLVGILTHAAIAETAKNAQKQKMQDQADQALQPFREQLAGFRYPELLLMAAQRVSAAGQRVAFPAALVPGGWVISSTPVFAMTPDRQALVMDNAIALFPPGETAKPAYATTVRVVSSPRGEADPVAYWAAPAEGGTVLREESARLLAHSLDIALRDSGRPAGGTEARFRTIRYREGSVEKMERSQPLETQCRRLIVRNLRGWLMSLPQQEHPDGPAASCEGSASR
jgi:hypothetical protein